ncbi:MULTISPECIES: hypothetical protein [unclassified Streptomyces]|uniref:hypothetical protein n=1 Tax=unclassified Streptomyces TaxID=2593676 RepID=UPI000DAECD3A|nr:MULTISPECIES: hypothetical protein [unclassified Streptomyces]PZT76628.1 hypothetical protein DNK56_25330 [Streptomyces sp. AC1-42W]PZT79415.1 hypothetical protein DNK55_07350 [Streptomyces sp. AC1-42T]
MLQCTAYTKIPELDALVALTTMEGGPEQPPDALAFGDHLMCELGEHDDHQEHAAQLWSAEIPAERDLWLLWNGTDANRAYRFTELTPCPALYRPDSVEHCEACVFYAGHPAAHSWNVRDPLGRLLEDIARRHVRQMFTDGLDET